MGDINIVSQITMRFEAQPVGSHIGYIYIYININIYIYMYTYLYIHIYIYGYMQPFDISVDLHPHHPQLQHRSPCHFPRRPRSGRLCRSWSRWTLEPAWKPRHWNQWVDLRENPWFPGNLQETIDFPMKIMGFSCIFPINQSIEQCSDSMVNFQQSKAPQDLK